MSYVDLEDWIATGLVEPGIPDPEPLVQCRRCEAFMPESEFQPSELDHWSSRPCCRRCLRTPDQNRTYNLTKHGISTDEYSRLLENQGGGCAICGRADPGGRGRFHIDHDHSCCAGTNSCGNCVRGLLCMRCNTGLGHFRDSPELLRAASNYLERTPARVG